MRGEKRKWGIECQPGCVSLWEPLLLLPPFKSSAHPVTLFFPRYSSRIGNSSPLFTNPQVPHTPCGFLHSARTSASHLLTEFSSVISFWKMCLFPYRTLPDVIGLPLPTQANSAVIGCPGELYQGAELTARTAAWGRTFHCSDGAVLNIPRASVVSHLGEVDQRWMGLETSGGAGYVCLP